MKDESRFPIEVRILGDVFFTWISGVSFALTFALFFSTGRWTFGALAFYFLLFPMGRAWRRIRGVGHDVR